ncbi:GumC family protein [Sphingomonas sp. IC081]|uniref:GumC family protein n=1 Tax=Sphingomonas sp. IC081 TaxID=304378 RepID=UPI00115A52E7|nr:polysaccharide biosynthesis tyrosine autokinase [Sphingomonas sp. IC081]QDK31502.1 capsular exopolysaccharide family protein [Sphingomonas sp. IC081]
MQQVIELERMAGLNLKDLQSAEGSQEGDFAGWGADTSLEVILKKVIAIVRRNVLLIAATVASVVVFGAIVTMLITPKYDSQAQVLVEDQADQIIEGSDLQRAGAAWDTDRFLQTQLGILQSRSLARSVVEAGRFHEDAAFYSAMGVDMPSDDDLAREGFAKKAYGNARKDVAIDALTEALSVKLPMNSRIIAITIKSRSPEYAANLANMFAERYIDGNLRQKYESSAYARKFLADQLEQARTKVTQSEHDLNRYARAAGLIRVSNQGDSSKPEAELSVTGSTLVQLNDAASRATADRIAAQDRWQAISKAAPLSISEVNSNQAVQALVGEKARVEAELADARSRYVDDAPQVKAKKAQLAEFDRRIGVIAESIKRSSYLDYQSASEREQSLMAKVDSLRNEALNEQDRGVQYSVLKRIADTNRALYDTLLSRYNQINAIAGAAVNNITLVDRAEVPTEPSSPKLILNIALSFIVGLLVAAAAVLLREVFDGSIRSPEDVEVKVGLPLLGLIPLEPKRDVNDALEDRRSGVGEAYSTLVTNLRYSTANGLPELLMVTSSREGEGKSTASRTIARDLARLGKRVLLVDADLRRPTLHGYLAERNKRGLADYLTNQKTFDEIVAPTDVENLNYVTALPMPPDPALLLGGEGVNRFVADARARYDLVIIDSPPLLGLSDAALLANHADGVLFVIDASVFHRGALKSALRRLKLVNAKILGVVLNRFDPKNSGDNYSYYDSYYTYGQAED